MTELAQRYLRLGLRLGRLGSGIVDSYFGPAELAEEVAAQPLPTAADVAAEAEAHLDGLPDGWLRDQTVAVHTYAKVLAGERFSYTEEVKNCYGITPEHTPEEVFEASHARLSDLLPGAGPLPDRYNAWRDAQVLAAEDVEPLVRQLITAARAWTETLITLPPGEQMDLEFVSGEPWSGYNEYLGGLRGLTSICTDMPRTTLDLLHLVLHEAYPGHQAERVLKDHFLVRGKQQLEETIVLLPTPQSVISEGLAELAPELFLDSVAGQELASRLGVDLAHARAIEEAARPINFSVVNAALMRYESGASDDAVRHYLRRWGLARDERIERVLGFMDAPGGRTYVVVYPNGRNLCRSYVSGDLNRFRTLLTEQLRVSDLTGSR